MPLREPGRGRCEVVVRPRCQVRGSLLLSGGQASPSPEVGLCLPSHGHFLSWPGVTCSPDCPQTLPGLFSNPPAALLTPCQFLGYSIYHPQADPGRAQEFNAEFLSFFFKDPFCPFPGTWKARVPGPRRVSPFMDAQSLWKAVLLCL